jgi:TetR/AcrR family transcriptional regulator, transcriptional repressor for nem operon
MRNRATPRRRRSDGTDPGDKRTRLVETAAGLTHEHGFNRTSLADIAHASGVPLGNVYYYFKTKDALGEALVVRLAAMYQGLRGRWEAHANPRRRLETFIQMTIDNRAALARSGCPIGTLCAELHKDGGPLADRASQLFAELLTWLEAQFRTLGKGEESADLAVHLLSALQGATLLTHAFHSTRYVEREAGRLKAWIRSL